MYDQARKLVLAGLGIGAQGRDQFEEWVRQGEENDAEYAKAIRKFMSEAEKNKDKWNNRCRELSDRVFQCLPIPTRSDIERLEKKVSDLASQLDRAGKK